MNVKAAAPRREPGGKPEWIDSNMGFDRAGVRSAGQEPGRDFHGRVAISLIRLTERLDAGDPGRRNFTGMSAHLTEHARRQGVKRLFSARRARIEKRAPSGIVPGP